jgi:hypothetical protein
MNANLIPIKDIGELIEAMNDWPYLKNTCDIRLDFITIAEYEMSDFSRRDVSRSYA